MSADNDQSKKDTFLTSTIFEGLINRNEKAKTPDSYQFSQADFDTILERTKYYGIGIYSVTAWQNGKVFETISHTEMKKKATDPRWSISAFIQLKKKENDLFYSAAYKVSGKLILGKKAPK